ncbi:DUF456 domain-containing protein [Kocuria sp. JC486]|uniref:DUF456 domain-containing protein n=1 Tax=Kocuria sp. JC486 TaxID=1970736 RepID=UPI0014249F48|nr:DUF456 domain-containing protein [Kocuria sp. JC486]NHU85824.1 DUF456 domain-containing protein [Kocuria sp. JC486]
MTPEIIATIVTVLLIAVGTVGIIVPVLPGSVTILIGLLIWAFVVQSVEGWVALALGGTLVIAGMSASWILTGQRLKKREIPNRSLLFGVIGAVVGVFVIPVVGLFVGFIVGLLGSETYRHKDLNAALESSWVAAKAMGIGILVELLCAMIAISTFVVCAVVHFATI